MAHPDRRIEPRPRPETDPAPAVFDEPEGRTAIDEPTGRLVDDSLRLVGHTVEEVRDGVVGVEVWIEWNGRTFSGAAVGPDAPAGRLRTPALAALRALHACLQVLYEGPVQPGLVLENAIQASVDGASVIVVSLTASESARPLPLTAAWADQGSPALAAILATLHATSRTVTRWLGQGRPVERADDAARDEHTDAVGAAATGQSAAVTSGGRLTLVDFAVDHGPFGSLDIGVRLAGFGGSVDGRRTGIDDEIGLLESGASATLQAIDELLRLGGWKEHHDGDLRSAGARRVRTGEQNLVVVLAEAIMNGHRVPLAGATSADRGLERACITATLQATNALVAERAAAIARAAGSGGDDSGPDWIQA
ncbi:MAG: hypothetical protein RJQ04_21215 [Longimicrobiales bacterium]